jgi:type IV secretion system protein VirB8
MSDHQTLDDKLETLRTFIEDNKDLEEFLAQSRGFADSQVQQAQRSERQAWRVAYAGGGLAVIAMLTVMGLTPLKTVTPSEVLVLDKSTGATSALQKLEEVIVSEEDVIMRKGINDFMLARASYTRRYRRNELLHRGSVHVA